MRRKIRGPISFNCFTSILDKKKFTREFTKRIQRRKSNKELSLIEKLIFSQLGLQPCHLCQNQTESCFIDPTIWCSKCLLYAILLIKMSIHRIYLFFAIQTSNTANVPASNCRSINSQFRNLIHLDNIDLYTDNFVTSKNSFFFLRDTQREGVFCKNIFRLHFP